MHTAARGKCKIHHIKRTGRTIKPVHQKADKFINLHYCRGKAEGIQTAAYSVSIQCGCYTFCLYKWEYNWIPLWVKNSFLVTLCCQCMLMCTSKPDVRDLCYCWHSANAEFKSTRRWKLLCISVCICWEGQHLNIFQLELLLVLSVQPIITAFYSWGEWYEIKQVCSQYSTKCWLYVSNHQEFYNLRIQNSQMLLFYQQEWQQPWNQDLEQHLMFLITVRLPVELEHHTSLELPLRIAGVVWRQSQQPNDAVQTGGQLNHLFLSRGSKDTHISDLPPQSKLKSHQISMESRMNS